jgi:hypothetical protein
LHPIAGADKPEDPGSLKTDAEYFPLKYGTAWTYNDKTSNQSFVVKVSAYEDLKVKQDDKEVTVRCALLETTVAGRKEVVGSELVGVSDDGVYRYRMGSDQLVEPPAKILSIPCKKGDTWKIDTKIQDKSVRLEYVVDEEEISIPGEAPDKPKKVAALKLKAKNFKVDDDEAQATLWYAKGIGMVKMEMQISGVSFILELEKFEPGS